MFLDSVTVEAVLPVLFVAQAFKAVNTLHGRRGNKKLTEARVPQRLLKARKIMKSRKSPSDH